MKYFDGILVVEGNNDASFVSSFIKSEIVVLNGYELENMDYLKQVSKYKKIIVLTDPDSAGREIAQKVIKELPESINICVDINCCSKKNKQGIAECNKEEILNKLDIFLKNEEVLQDFQIKISDIWKIADKKKIINDFHLGACNTKKIVERLNSLKVKVEQLNDYK